jgi:hypothetical protein
LSCDGFVESTAAPGSTPPNPPPSWSTRYRMRAALHPPLEEVPLSGGAEPSSPRSQASGSLKWANVVRQLQKSK